MTQNGGRNSMCHSDSSGDESNDDALQPHTISRHGSIDGDDANSQNQDDELASTGILILGPSQMTTTLQARRVAAKLDSTAAC